MRREESGRLAMRWLGSVALLCLMPAPALGAGAVCGGRAPVAQQQTQAPPQVPRMPSLAPPDDLPPDVRAHMAAQRARLVNDDRHRRLEQDASRLIALSNQLKAAIDATSKDELSMEVMRKAAEIEKLAHDVQNRMKN